MATPDVSSSAATPVRPRAATLWDRLLVSSSPTPPGPAMAPYGRTVRVQNVDVHVADRGAGRPILFIHGIPDTSDLWERAFEAMSATRRCIAFDLPGFGGSRVVNGAFNLGLANRAAFVAGVLDAIGVSEPVDLVGHDAGGTFAIPFMAAHAERVRRAHFCITTMHPDFRWSKLGQICRTPYKGELHMATMSWGSFRDSRRHIAGPHYAEADILAQYNRLDGAMRRAIIEFYRGTNIEEFPGWQTRFEAAMVGRPVHVIWGEHNPGNGVAVARRSYPGASLTNYLDSGHWPMREEPDRWNKEVAEFFGG
jgi:pimeloyl-ACP methyl ester carboxylesterase